MGNVLTLNFWFNLRPGVLLGASFKILLGFIVLLAAVAVIAAIGKKRWGQGLYSSFWKSLYGFSLTNAAIGLMLAWFNYEMVPFLSARFWFLLWAIGILTWTFFLLRTVSRIPQKKARLEKEREFKKYLP
ncbi:MAG: hypothetical protein PHS62_02780 [Patescibacteria group bacterium]|nr:hypothetical protein [Patescibacteria group bacterium]